MPLKDRIERDNEKVFINIDEFGTMHRWNDEEILCVVDSDIRTRHNRLNIIDNSFDVVMDELTIYARTKDIGYLPNAMDQVYFDGRDCRVLSAHDEMGIMEIGLRVFDVRNLS